MSHDHRKRTGWARREMLLTLAMLALIFQLFPSLWWGLWSALDVRAWSRTTWFVVNILVLLGLFAVRFGPQLYADWRKRVAGQQQRRHAAAQAHTDSDYEARLRRDAEWRARAKKRLPWY